MSASSCIRADAVSYTHLDVYKRQQPHCAETYNNLGGALHMAGRLDEAASAFQKAISLRPANPQAHGNLGAAMLQRGRLDEAIAAFSQALRLAPEFADAHSNLGLAHLLRGDLDDAVSSLRRALEPVSYTHLDVYKRQFLICVCSSP